MAALFKLPKMRQKRDPITNHRVSTLMDPPCAGAQANPPEVCPRCTAMAGHVCGDDRAYKAQLARNAELRKINLPPADPAEVNREIIRRIRALLEEVRMRNNSIGSGVDYMTDEEFDKLCMLVGIHGP